MPFSSSGGVLFDQCLDDEECGAAYVDALATTQTTVAGLDLIEQARQIAALLAPWQAKEIAEGSRAPYEAEEIEDAVADAIRFLEVRPQQLNKFLGIEETPPPTIPGPTPEPALPILPPEPIPGLSQRLEVDRSKLGRGLLITRVAAPAAGTVRQLAQIVTAAGPLQACVTRASVGAAGATTLRCRLSAAVRKRLEVRRLVLRLETRFEPEAGTASGFSTPVMIPRQG
jgi:hypothetical protein